MRGISARRDAGFSKPSGRRLDEHVGLARGEHALQAAEQREGKDDAAVLALFKIAAKEIGDGSAVGGEVVRGLGQAARETQARKGLGTTPNDRGEGPVDEEQRRGFAARTRGRNSSSAVLVEA